jgi:hypothetical protein
MSKEWQTKTLGEVCGFVRGPFGGSLKKSIFVEEGIAVYEQQHAINNQFEEIRYFIDERKFREMERFELRPNDLIMSCSGTMGRVAIVPQNIRRGIINQALLKLTPSSSVLPEFLKYYMDSTNFQDSLQEQSGGAAIQNVASVGILKEIRIPFPPLSEQERQCTGDLSEYKGGEKNDSKDWCNREQHGKGAVQAQAAVEALFNGLGPVAVPGPESETTALREPAIQNERQKDNDEDGGHVAVTTF